MYEFWVVTPPVGTFAENEQMAWLNEVSKDTPEWEFVCFTPAGQPVFRKPLPPQVVEDEVSIVFGPRNRNWSDDRTYNSLYVSGIFKHFSNRLAQRGHVFLNEIYDALGIDRTPQGAITGWLYDPGKTIEYSIVGVAKQKEFTIRLNTQGVIYDKI